MKLRVIITLCIIISGCVSVKYNTQTKEVSYTRIGAQKLSGILLEQDGNKVSILIESQQSEARMFNDALKLIEKGIEIGAKQ